MDNKKVSTSAEIVTEDGTSKEWGIMIAYRSYTIEGITVKDEKEFLKYLMPYVDLVSFCFTNRTDFYGFDDEDDFVEGYEAFCNYYSEKDWTWFNMDCRTKPGKFKVYNISFDVEPDSMTVKAYCISREGLIEFETALQSSVSAFNRGHQ